MDKTHSETRRLDLSVPIEQRFTLESRIAYSFSGEVFKAKDRSTRSSIALWVSRKPLDQESSGNFLRRTGQLAALVGRPEILAFGLDPQGRGWVSLRLFSSRHILDGRVELLEAERRWLGCVRAVERLHKGGLACGDVCLDSFVLTGAGDVCFFGGFGAFAPPSEFLAGVPSQEADELRSYLAPEQLQQQPALMSSDVFALARVACRFINNKPLAKPANGVRLSSNGQQPSAHRIPPWFSAVVEPMLVGSPEKRPQDASALIKALLRERIEVTAKTQGSQGPPSSSTEAEGVFVEMPVRRRRSRWLYSAVLVVTVVIGGVLGLGLLSSGGRARTSWLHGLFSSARVSPEEVRSLAASDDPMAHEALVRMAGAAAAGADREIVIDGLIGRSRRLGLPRSADLVRSWFTDSPSSRLLAKDAPLGLKAINPSLSEAARQEVVTKAVQTDTAPGAQLAAALALDIEQKDLFRPLFEAVAKEQGRVKDTSGHSTAAIMTAVPPIRALYLADLLSDPALTPADAVWLLARLGEQGEPNVRPVAALGLKNGSFSGPQRVFAEALTGPAAMSVRERAVFVACLTGVPTKANAIALVSSYNPSASRALFAILWLSDEPAVREAAMDGLLAKPLSDSGLQVVAEYIRSKKPGERDRYSKVFAAAGLSNLLTDDEFSAGFVLLREGSPEPELIPILLKRAPPRVVFEVLGASGDRLQAPVYLDLLKHPSKEVRIEALKRLRNFNDATMFALVRQMYNDERDGDVRREYELFLSS